MGNDWQTPLVAKNGVLRCVRFRMAAVLQEQAVFHTLVSISDVIPNPFDPQGGLSAPQRVLAEEVALPEGFAAGLWAPAVGKTVPLLAQAFLSFHLSFLAAEIILCWRTGRVFLQAPPRSVAGTVPCHL